MKKPILTILCVIAVYLSIIILAEASVVPSMNFTTTPIEFAYEFPIGISKAVVKKVYGTPKMTIRGVFKHQESWMYYSGSETFRFDFVHNKVWDVTIDDMQIKAVWHPEAATEDRVTEFSARRAQNITPIKYRPHQIYKKPGTPIPSITIIFAITFVFSVSIIGWFAFTSVKKD